jgi:hypothetical protein
VPKFNVSISFSLRTEIEPEGIYFDRNAPEGAEEVEDGSYWRRAEVDADGGNLTFVVECEDEDAARTVSEEFVYDGQEWEDDSGFTWVVADVDVEVEKVEIPMDLDRAKSLVVSFLDGFEALDEEYEEAFSFILDLVVSQSEALSAQRSTVAALESQVLRLQGEMDRLRNGPDGSEAPTT